MDPFNALLGPVKPRSTDGAFLGHLRAIASVPVGIVAIVLFLAWQYTKILLLLVAFVAFIAGFFFGPVLHVYGLILCAIGLFVQFKDFCVALGRSRRR